MAPTTSLGKWLKADSDQVFAQELNEDLAAPDAFGMLPFGDWLRKDHHAVCREELKADLAASDWMWNIF